MGFGKTIIDGIPIFDLKKYESELRKYQDEYKPGNFKKDLEESLEEKRSKTRDLEAEMEDYKPRKASSELSREGLLKIMMAKMKPSSLDKKDEADSSNMVVAITNLDSMNEFKECVKEMVKSNQLIKAMDLQGEEIEAYAPVEQRFEAYYRDHPEKRDTITGRVVDYSVEGKKLYLHLYNGPGMPKDSEGVTKVEFNNIKKVLPKSTPDTSDLLQNLLISNQFRDALSLKGQEIEAFLPQSAKDEPLEDRVTVKGKVREISKEDKNIYLKLELEENKFVKVNFNDWKKI